LVTAADKHFHYMMTVFPVMSGRHIVAPRAPGKWCFFFFEKDEENFEKEKENT